MRSMRASASFRRTCPGPCRAPRWSCRESARAVLLWIAEVGDDRIAGGAEGLLPGGRPVHAREDRSSVLHLYQHAVELDPQFAMAWSAMATSTSVRTSWAWLPRPLIEDWRNADPIGSRCRRSKPSWRGCRNGISAATARAAVSLPQVYRGLNDGGSSPGAVPQSLSGVGESVKASVPPRRVKDSGRNVCALGLPSTSSRWT